MPEWTGRSLEGRPLGMCCSVMLPASSRLRLLDLGSSFVTALGEQRHPMTGLTTASQSLDMRDPAVFRHEAMVALNELLYLNVGRHPCPPRSRTPARTMRMVPRMAGR